MPFKKKKLNLLKACKNKNEIAKLNLLKAKNNSITYEIAKFYILIDKNNKIKADVFTTEL